VTFTRIAARSALPLLAIVIAVAALVAPGSLNATAIAETKPAQRPGLTFPNPQDAPAGEVIATPIRFDRKPGGKECNGKRLAIPYIHHDGSHYASGILRVYVDKQGWLAVESSGDRAVSYVGMNSDESMARLGITAGASGGGRLTRIALYRNGRFLRADSPTLCVNGLNGWFFAIQRTRVTVAP
jgi:hypothetical protein